MTYACFDTSKLDLDCIATELYDLTKPGCIAVNDFIFLDFRQALWAEVKNGPFSKQQNVYKNAEQDLSIFFVDPKQNPYTHLALLHALYQHAYYTLAKKAGFQEKTRSRIAVHKYDQGSIGITPHKDERKYLNMISIFILAGKAPFSLYKSRQEKIGELDAQPGSLILLRAPRSKTEDGRPMHSIGPVLEERYSICFRELLDQELEHI